MLGQTSPDSAAADSGSDDYDEDCNNYQVAHK